MAPVDVVWKSYHEPEAINRGYWDQGILEDLFKRGEFNHHTEVTDIEDGAVFVLNGRMHATDIASITEDLLKLRWVLLIITGDEEAVFPIEDIKHPLLRVWMQLPRMNRHNDVSFKLPNGYRPETRDLLKKIGYQEKAQDWFFAGQVNHERREQCVQELKYLIDSGESPNGTYLTGNTFGKEILPYETYLGHLARTKVALCPSGIETPDNFRLYEALEAGCLPVVDAFSTNNKSPGFWQYLFAENPPFPVVDYWDKLIPLMPQLLKEYPANANKVFAWWQQFKQKLYYKLIDDIKEISK